MQVGSQQLRAQDPVPVRICGAEGIIEQLTVKGTRDGREETVTGTGTGGGDGNENGNGNGHEGVDGGGKRGGNGDQNGGEGMYGHHT